MLPDRRQVHRVCNLETNVVGDGATLTRFPSRERPGGQERVSRVTPVDGHVGKRIRMRRGQLGMSQERLADALGITFQQVQKYEGGVNRVGASRLFDLTQVLGVKIAYFFEDIPESLTKVYGENDADDAVTAAAGIGAEQIHSRETAELIGAYYRIGTPEMRKRVLDLIKSMAPSSEQAA